MNKNWGALVVTLFFLPFTAQSAPYKVRSIAGELELRCPGSPFFRIVHGQTDAFPGCRLRGVPRFPFQTPRFNVVQKGIKKEFEYIGERLFVLPLTLEKERQLIHETVADASVLPRLENAAHQVTDARRIVTLVEGAFSLKKLPKVKSIVDAPELQKHTPIHALYPGPVEVIETDRFPVQIDLGWDVASGQVEPHSVYLWSEDMPAYSPYVLAESGNATIAIARHGKYFWQIQDASGNFVSFPRTILVRPVSNFHFESDSSGGPLISILNIKPNSVFSGCIRGGAWFDALIRSPRGAEEVSIESKPLDAIKSVTLDVRNRDNELVEIPITPKRVGGMTFRIVAKNSGQILTVSEFYPVKFEKSCGDANERWRALESDYPILSPGALVFLR